MLSDDAAALLSSVEEFMSFVEADPTILNDPRASKIKKVFTKLGASIPASNKPTKNSPNKSQSEQPAPAPESAAAEEEEEEEDPERMEPETEPLPAMPDKESDDWEGAGTFKETANEAKANGDLNGAVDAFTKALNCQQSALTFANRADCLLKLKRPTAAIADCDAALKVNPDSAKALKIRGKALRFLGRWEEAHGALSKAMAIDFDPDLQEMYKFVEKKAKTIQERKTKDRLREQEEAKKKREEERAKAKRAKAHNDEAAAFKKMQDMCDKAGLPGGLPGMPGFSGKMPGMGGPPCSVRYDPGSMAALNNPKVKAAFDLGMAGDLSGMNSAMRDPETRPLLLTLQKSLGAMGIFMPGVNSIDGVMGDGSAEENEGGGEEDNNEEEEEEDEKDERAQYVSIGPGLDSNGMPQITKHYETESTQRMMNALDHPKVKAAMDLLKKQDFAGFEAAKQDPEFTAEFTAAFKEGLDFS